MMEQIGKFGLAFAKLRFGFVLWFLLCSSCLGGYITSNEAGMDAVFSQSSFGSSPIGIRFGSPVTIISSAVASIDSSADFSALTTLAPSHPLLFVNLFFVDQIEWCGIPAPGAVGCASLGFGIAAVESDFAAGLFGTELNAHEVGHTLGLSHTANPPGAGLMGPFLNGDTSLSALEVATIRNSSLIRTDQSGFYIQVTPVRVLAAVPEPGSAFVLFLIASAALVRHRRHAVQPV